MTFIMGRVDKRNWTFSSQVAQLLELFAMFADLLRIASTEFFPAGGIVCEPFSQLRARREFFCPMIDRSVRLFEPRGQSRSTSTRVPSSAAGRSYARFIFTLSPGIFSVIASTSTLHSPQRHRAQWHDWEIKSSFWNRTEEMASNHQWTWSFRGEE